MNYSSKRRGNSIDSTDNSTRRRSNSIQVDPYYESPSYLQWKQDREVILKNKKQEQIDYEVQAKEKAIKEKNILIESFNEKKRQHHERALHNEMKLLSVYNDDNSGIWNTISNLIKENNRDDNPFDFENKLRMRELIVDLCNDELHRTAEPKKNN